MAGHQRHRSDMTPMMVFAIFSAVLGMFQFGFNTGVINAPQKVLEEFIANIYKTRTGNWITEELRDVIWSITVSIFAIGGMLGGLMGAKVADWCGRKTGLVLNNTIAVVGVTLMSSSQLSQSIECLIIGRFFIGLNCGLNTALVPMYLTEISTVNMRGALGTVSQLGVTIGLLFSQVLGLNTILGTKDLWPFLFGFAFVPAVLQLIMLPFCPESPRYLLLSCGRISDARMALRRLRASSDVESDIEEMRAEDRAHHEEVRKYGKLNSIKELFQHPHLRTPMIIGIMMQLSQQLSGINAIFYYSTDIFLSAEVPEDYAVYATMGVGVIMVIMTLISIPLMDRLGRRALHLYGLGGMFLASIFLTISLLVKFLYDWMKYTSVISILMFTVFFGIGPGSIPFMITAELFTQGTRPAAMSVSVLFNWLSNFSVGLAFPIMKRVLQSYLFLPFTVFLAIFWIFTYKKLPETKNRTFEEIAALFKPIQFGTGGGSSFGFPDYGSNPGTSGPEFPIGSHQMIPGSPLNMASAKIAPQDRFRFDPAATGSFINEQQQQQQQRTNCLLHHAANQVCPEHCTYASTAIQSEQGNAPFYSHANHANCHSSSSHLPHNSCTSIHTQNLSTNDQQPLIVDVVCNNNNNNTTNHNHNNYCNQHDHHHHRYIQQQQQHQHMISHDNNCLKHNHHSPHSNMTNSSNIVSQQTAAGLNNNQVTTSTTRNSSDAACCCDLLDTTTSFMAADSCHTAAKLPQQSSNCFYCRRDSQLATAASNKTSDGLGGRYNEYPPINAKDPTTRDNELYNGQMKSRTLTRTTYKPLNDMYFANQQPHHTRLSNNDQV